MKTSKRYYYSSISILLSITILNIYFTSCNIKKNQSNGLLNASELVNNPIEEGGKYSGDTSLLPKIHFYETEFDFGDKIMEGEVVQHIFKFKNTGKSPLIIRTTQTTCGCTASEFSKEPVAPNADGQIKITFNSTGKPGDFQKTISVIANTIPNESKLLIIGDVIPIKED
ncbi:MAG: hypothetical protein RL065_2207 [Bacteroidota bacterium]|jgi:hypothetical protein